MDERTKQLLTLGREHYARGEYDKAEHYFRQVLERTVSVADVFNMMGVIHHDRGRFQDAKMEFERAVALNPKYTEAALNLAVTCNDLGDYESAQRTYQQALARDSQYPGGLDPWSISTFTFIFDPPYRRAAMADTR